MSYLGVLKVFIALIAVSTYYGCNKCEDISDPSCPGYDKCLVEEELTKVHIRITQLIKSGEDSVFVESDTLINQGFVYFEIIGEDIGVFKWKVGDDPRVFNERKFGLHFDGFDGDMNITVDFTHFCSTTNILGIRSKKIHVVNVKNWVHEVGLTDQPIYGKYYGFDTYNQALRDTITISTGWAIDPYKYGITSFPITCVDRDINHYPALTFSASWRTFIVGNPGFPPRLCFPYAVGSLSEDHRELVIDYWYFELDSSGYYNTMDTIRRTFIGQKIE